MSSTSTSWTTQGNTKAGATSTSADSLTTGTLTADTIQLASNIIKASDGGSTITLDTSDNVTILGDLAISGGNITTALTLDSTLTVTNTSQLNNTLTVGVDDAGHDVIFYGNTASQNMMWDASQNDLEFTDDAQAKWGTGADFKIGHDGTDTFLTNDEGKLVIENEASANMEIKCVSGQTIELGHATSTVEIKDNLQINDGLIFNAAAQITCLDNNSAALKIGSSGKLDLVTIGTTNTQETVIIDADRASGAGSNLGAIKLIATAVMTGNTTDSNMGGLYLGGPTFITADGGTHTTTRHNYIKVDDANFTNTSGSSTVTDVCLFEFENNLNTSGSCTTNSDKTGEAKSGTIKVNVNGTKYHIQLYAD